jgi:hypothetical protein
MLRDIIPWLDETVYIAAPYLNTLVPLLQELRDIMNDQVRTGHSKMYGLETVKISASVLV